MASISLGPASFHSPISERQKIIYAIIASILIQIPFFAMILWGLLSTDKKSDSLEALKVVEVTVSTPTPTPVPEMLSQMPEPAATPPIISSNGLHTTEQAPVNPAFQSDMNSVAGSTQPAKGNVPLPGQDGKMRPELAFETQRYTAGDADGGAAAPPVMEFAPAPAPDLSHPLRASVAPVLRPQTSPTPQPTPNVTPTPQPTPEVTPTPAQKMAAPTPVPQPSAGEVPLFNPTPAVTPAPMETPDDLARPTPIATPKPVASVAMLMTPRPQINPSQPSRPQPPGYHPDTEQTKLEGGISNRGPQGASMIGTPVGRYQKRIADAIGSRWNYYIHQRMDLITMGTVRIRFYINRTGHVEDVKVISNESNETLADYSVQAITAAQIPPPPPELAPALEDGRYEVTYTFTIYPD